jgi:hypothetical protein
MSKLECPVIPKTKSREAFTRNDVSSFRKFQITGDRLQREEGLGGLSRENYRRFVRPMATHATPPVQHPNIGVKNARSKTRRADKDLIVSNFRGEELAAFNCCFQLLLSIF